MMMIMKKIFYILSVLLLAAVGCSKEQGIVDNPESSEFPEGAMVTVNFSVPAPAETRAGMANEPIIENIKVAVFNAAGLLKEYTDAEPIGSYATQNGVWYKYKVRLLLSSTERRLHFIANGPATIENGTESVVIRGLVTENGAAAYWQRVVLTDGVTPFAYPGGVYTYTWYDENNVIQHATYGTEGGVSYTDSNNKTVNVGDYVQENGDKVVDGTGYFASVATSDALAKIPLVRNFARIAMIDDKTDNTVTFHPIRYRLINIPTKGSIAPYDSKAGAYVQPYLDAYEKVSSDYLFKYNDIFNWGYQAEMPAGATLATLTKDDLQDEDGVPIEGMFKQVNVQSSASDPIDFDALTYEYMYERPLPTAENAATCVLVEGTLTDTQEHANAGKRWFKIEVTDLDGKNVPIYRDVTYVMKIKSITIVGTPGWATPWEAYNNKSVGDVSTSAETATLTQISDGKGTTLWVDFIDYTSVEPDGTTVPIRYKLTYNDQSLTSSVTLRIDNSDALDPAITVTSLTGEAYSGTDTQDGQSGWYVAQVPLAAQGALMKKSTLHIEGGTGASNGSKVLFRNVDFRVIPSQKFGLEVDPTSIPNGVGQEVKLSITLPKDLGFSVFPLTIKIEPKAGNLNPVASKNKLGDEFISLPVEYGGSMFEDKTDNSFCFLFTVNFSNYNQATGSTYDLYFSTIRGGENHTTIAVQDKKPYFELDTVEI